MEETIVEQTELEEVKSEVNTNETVSYGKFKDADALYKAYNALESEFTKRCQKIKELEGKIERVDKQEERSLDGISQESVPTEKEISVEEENEVIQKYLKALISSKPKAVMIKGGESVVTPVKRPKTIAEAGNLAKEIILQK